MKFKGAINKMGWIKNIIFLIVLLTQIIPAQRAAASASSTSETEILVFGASAAYRTVSIAAKVAGNVEYMPFAEGDYVKSGEVVLRVEKTDYELQVALARTQVERAKIALDQANLEFSRLNELVKSNSASVQMKDNALYAKLSAQANLATAVASLKIAENMLNNAEICAPMNGFVSVKHREPGDYADKAKPVYDIVDLDIIKANLKVPELLISEIKKGDKINISVDVYPDETFSGEIYEVSPVGDPLTHFFKVTALIKNTEHKLKAGMFLKALIKTDKK
jgi:RND family efflux transporter MFP subunit